MSASSDDMRVRLGGDTAQFDRAIADARQKITAFRSQAGADVGAFERLFGGQMAQAGRSAQRFGGDVAGANRRLSELRGAVNLARGALGAFGISLGAAGLVAFGRHVIDTVGNIGEQAEAMGVSTEAFQIYNHVAGQTNVKQEQLQQGMARLTREIGQAAQGNDAAIAKFAELGVGVLDLDGKLRSVEHIFQDVARAIQAMEDPQRRATAAAELFGDEAGNRFLPLLNEIARGYGEVAREAKAAGAVIEDDVIRRFDVAADVIERKGRRVTTWIAESLADSLRLWEVITKLMEFSARIGTGAQPPLPPMDWNRAADELDIGVQAGPRTTRNPPSQAELKRAEALRTYLAGLERAAELAGMETTERKVQQALVEARAKIQRDLTAGEAERVRSAVEATARAEREATIAQTLERMDERRTELAASRSRDVERSIAALERTVEIERLTGVEREKARAIFEAQNRLLDEQGRAIRDLTDAERARIEAAIGIRDQIERQRQATQAFADLAAQSFDRLGQAITSSLVGGAFEWRNVMLGVIGEIMQAMLRLAVINPIMNSLFGLALPALGALGGGAAAGAAAGGGTALSPTAFPFVAHGGRGPHERGVQRAVPSAIFAAAPRLHSGLMAGEVPAIIKDDESVLTPAQMRAVGGGARSVVIYQTNDFRGSDTKDWARQRAFADTIKRETKAEIRAELDAGGSFSRAAGRRR